MQIKALPGNVLVSDLERGERKIGNIILPDDNGKSSGVRPRWAKVFAIGEDITDVEVGNWVLIEHGRWTRAFMFTRGDEPETQIWGVDWPDAVMLVSDTKPETTTLSQWA